MSEQWRPCKGFQHYEVSNLGRVRRDGRLLKLQRNKLGYVWIGLFQGGKLARRYVHRLVIEAFHSDRPPGMEVDHINHKRDDNRAENLRWVTHAENMHRRLTMVGRSGRNTPMAEEEVRQVHRRRAAGSPLSEIAQAHSLTVGQVSHILTGRRWHNVWLAMREELGPNWHGSCAKTDRRGATSRYWGDRSAQKRLVVRRGTEPKPLQGFEDASVCGAMWPRKDILRNQ